MDFHRIWVEQCEAAQGIEDEFDTEEIDEMRMDNIRQCTRDLLLVERAREWLSDDIRIR